MERGCATGQVDPSTNCYQQVLVFAGHLLEATGLNQTFANALRTASIRIGMWRRRAPVAAKMALAMAGATTVAAGSPSPTAASALAMNSMRSRGYVGHAQRRVGIEVGIADFALRDCGAFVKGHAQAPQRGTLHLRQRAIGMDGGAGIGDQPRVLPR